MGKPRERNDGLRAGRPGFGSQQGEPTFLFSTAFRPALELTQPFIQRIPGPPFPGEKWPRRAADHLPPSDAEVTNGGAIPPLNYLSTGDNFTSYHLPTDNHDLFP
jgi:hypothetical protein